MVMPVLVFKKQPSSEAVKEEDRAKKKIGDRKRWKGLWSHLEVDCSRSLSSLTVSQYQALMDGSDGERYQ